MGRMVHSDVTGTQPLAPSAITPPGEAHTYDGKKPFEQPRAATLDDIARVLDDYARAARNAIAAGFDGVQIHAANGYLIDEFLRETSNRRDDDYGGPIANRVRLLREVAQRVADTIGAERTGRSLVAQRLGQRGRRFKPCRLVHRGGPDARRSRHSLDRDASARPAVELSPDRSGAGVALYAQGVSRQDRAEQRLSAGQRVGHD